jgi:hypothetical protein
LDLYFGPFVHSHQKLPQRSMIDHLEMLTAREQLMEDIDSIVETFCWEMWEGKYPETQEDLTRLLCDAVCKNFPAN